jgi:tryptophanyl-tRNA synthetase
LAPIQARAQEYLEDPKLVLNIITEGCDAARDVAGDTMDEVRAAMGLVYR